MFALYIRKLAWVLDAGGGFETHNDSLGSYYLVCWIIVRVALVLPADICAGLLIYLLFCTTCALNERHLSWSQHSSLNRQKENPTLSIRIFLLVFNVWFNLYSCSLDMGCVRTGIGRQPIILSMGWLSSCKLCVHYHRTS